MPGFPAYHGLLRFWYSLFFRNDWGLTRLAYRKNSNACLRCYPVWATWIPRSSPDYDARHGNRLLRCQIQCRGARTSLDGRDLPGYPQLSLPLLQFALIVYYLLHLSVFGRYLLALGRNEQAARYSGINTVLIMAFAYIICSVLAAVSALFFALYTADVVPSIHGNFFELYAIAGAVLGGCSLRGGEGTVIGIVLGTTVLLVLQNMVNLLGYDSSFSKVITALVILGGVLVDRFDIWRLLSRPKNASAT